MLTKQEWPQLGMALVHAQVHVIDGRPVVPLVAVLDILRTYAAPGCSFGLQANGVINLDVAADEVKPPTDDQLEVRRGILAALAGDKP